MKTFYQIRTEQEIYSGTTTTIPAEVQTAINEWYDSREVCDNEYFPRFFRRILNRDYIRYTQLLRIEPGISQYDWLVSQYKEAQLYQQEERTAAETSETETIGESTNAENSTDTTTRDDTITHRDARTESRSSLGENIRTPDLTDATQGTTSGTNSETTTNDTTTDTETNTEGKSLSKSQPQSISYENATAGEIPDLNWRFPGAQTQDSTESNGSTTTDVSGTTSGTTTGTNSDTTTRTGTETIESTGSENITYGGTLTDVTDGETIVTKNGTGTKTDETTTTGTKTANDTAERLNQSIDSGRSESPAELLQKATTYIKRSSAIMWLLDRLEPCFMGIYD